ncbi:MAG: NUDIX hydrolase [Opitutaceae bacterium]|nr:NUDIX hydrolase [Opitutaceae bacterium]
MSNGTPSRWKKLGESTLAATRIFDLRTARYHHPVRQVERDFYVVHSRDWVNVLALTTDNQLVLVNQFRFGVDTFSLEIPGGVIEVGEDPVVAGVRELEEETGFIGQNPKLIASVHPNPAIMSNRCHLVLVEQCQRVSSQAWDTDEEIQVSTAPIDDVFRWVAEGKITHSLVLNALLFLKLKGEVTNRP